jgi:hypothetical protein
MSASPIPPEDEARAAAQRLIYGYLGQLLKVDTDNPTLKLPETVLAEIREQQDERNQHWRAIVGPRLQAAGVATAELTYCGYGDEGDTWDILAVDHAGQPVDLPDDLEEQLDSLLALAVPLGYEDNYGGQGTVRLDVDSGTLEAEGSRNESERTALASPSILQAPYPAWLQDDLEVAMVGYTGEADAELQQGWADHLQDWRSEAVGEPDAGIVETLSDHIAVYGENPQVTRALARLLAYALLSGHVNTDEVLAAESEEVSITAEEVTFYGAWSRVQHPREPQVIDLGRPVPPPGRIQRP